MSTGEFLSQQLFLRHASDKTPPTVPSSPSAPADLSRADVAFKTDWARVAKMGSAGFLMTAPVFHSFYQLVDKRVPFLAVAHPASPPVPPTTRGSHSAGKMAARPWSQLQLSPARKAIVKVLLESTTIGPIHLFLLMSYSTAVDFWLRHRRETEEGSAADPPPNSFWQQLWGAVHHKISSDYMRTLATAWCVVPLAQFINFRYVPAHLRLLYFNSFSLVWNTYLTALINGHYSRTLWDALSPPTVKAATPWQK